MNAEKLLALYERLSDAPGAITRLRRFVLDLAVRGKLVEQKHTEEPAHALLEELSQNQPGSSYRTPKSSLRKSIPGATTEAPHEVPPTWVWVRFSQVADFAAGRTPSRHEAAYWNTGDFAWASIADMVDGGTLLTTKETISQRAKRDVFKADPVPAGTILMSFKLTIGKIVRLGVPAFHNEAIVAIRPRRPELDPYLFKVLPDLARQGRTKDAIKGATLNRDSISNILVPLPPIAEQLRIVSKIEELAALLDRLEVALHRASSTRVHLLESVLAEAMQPEIQSRHPKKPLP